MRAMLRVSLWTMMLMLALQTVALAQTQLTMDIGGATKADMVDGQTEWVYQWPGIYFEGRFRGDSVSLHMDDANNEFDVLVDGQVMMVLKRPGKRVVTLGQLGPGAGWKSAPRRRSRRERLADSLWCGRKTR